MWLLCEPVCIGLAIGAAVSVWAWAACGRTAIGATAIRAPRPIATYLLIIAVPLEASLPTLVSRTMSICALHAELEMNVDLAARRRQTGQSCRAQGRPVVGRGSRSETHASALSSTFLRVAAGLPRWLPAAPPALCLPRPPRLSEDAGLSPSRVASLVFGAHATPRGLWEPGTIRSPLP